MRSMVEGSPRNWAIGYAASMKSIPESDWPRLVTPDRLSMPYYLEQFRITEERLALLGRDMPAFIEILRAGAKFMGMQRAEEKIGLVQSYHFSEELLQAMICGGEPYRPEPVSYIWQRLTEARLMFKTFGHLPGAFADHSINIAPLFRSIGTNTFQNILFPPANLVPRYSGSLIAIDVETSEGSESRGTGFIATNDVGRPAIVTCRHNIDPAEGISLKRLTTANGTQVDLAGEPIMSPTYDLALLPLTETPEEPIFRFEKELAVFDDVYTIGFPLIPHALPAVVSHRGEFNGRSEMYVDKSPILLISNLVSPGSSGCPVLNRHGFCVGMTTRWLEAEYEGERARFSAALPAEVIYPVL